MDRRLLLVLTLFVWVWTWGNAREAHTASVTPVEVARERLQPEDRRLQQALEWYRQLAATGGWPLLIDSPTLRLGDQGEYVKTLRARLQTSGDFPSLLLTPEGRHDAFPGAVGMFFDDELEQAVRTFQSRHGLHIDGIVGPATLAALNVPVEARITQMALNLDRWRHDTQALGERYILVNIPAFTLAVVEHDRAVMRMRVIVGKPYQRTPIFHATMTYLVLNPYWEVPPNIAKREILPEIHANPAYLEQNNMQVIGGWGQEVQIIDPATIDWTSVSSQDLPYRFRQEPGVQNALGQVKFKFPNAFNVYLHDTPTPSLFARPQRAFSHGCIRVEKPIDLAAYLLQDKPQWSQERILATMQGGTERRVNLLTPISVHIVYRTAWVDEDGTLQFRPDIYGYDKESEISFCGTVAKPCG